MAGHAKQGAIAAQNHNNFGLGGQGGDPGVGLIFQKNGIYSPVGTPEHQILTRLPGRRLVFFADNGHGAHRAHLPQLTTTIFSVIYQNHCHPATHRVTVFVGEGAKGRCSLVLPPQTILKRSTPWN